MLTLLRPILFVLLSTCSAVAQSGLSGQYDVRGANPGNVGQYTGKAEITKTGDVFQVQWTIGSQKHSGTGILTGDVFSVVYQAPGTSPGIAVYEIGSNGTLSGSWTSLGADSLGIEIWTRDSGI